MAKLAAGALSPGEELAVRSRSARVHAPGGDGDNVIQAFHNRGLCDEGTAGLTALTLNIPAPAEAMRIESMTLAAPSQRKLRAASQLPWGDGLCWLGVRGL